jgi:hypothetical protein
MAGNLWVTNSLGGYLANAQLSGKLRVQAQTLTRFRQFSTVKEAFGKGKSDTFNYDKIGNVATAGGTLTETNTTPVTNFTVTKGTLTVNEYGKLFAALVSSLVNKFCAKVFSFSVTVSA